MFRLLTEKPDDAYEVEYLFDLAFAPGRTALSSYRLREGVGPVSDLCLVARDDFDAIGGAIRYWPVLAASAPALLLGPVAVHPTRQGEGLGAVLVAESLDRARALGWERVVLVGDEPYYKRFGFTRATAHGLSFPPPTNPDRLLAHALISDAFSGLKGGVARWPGPNVTGKAPSPEIEKNSAQGSRKAAP